MSDMRQFLRDFVVCVTLPLPFLKLKIGTPVTTACAQERSQQFFCCAFFLFLTVEPVWNSGADGQTEG